MKKVKVTPKLWLDVGTGNNAQQGYVNMDVRPLPGIDIVHDIEVIPWPIKDEACTVIRMSNIVEHIKPWLMVDVINEAWRVMKPNGVLLVSTPYAGSYLYWKDPTHCCGWNDTTPEYFNPEHAMYEVYKPKPWKIEKKTWSLNGWVEVAFRKISSTDTEKSGKSKD